MIVPRNLETIGVSASVKDSDVAHATDDQQDQYIKEVAGKLTDDLRRFVGGARPRSDFQFWVTGPHSDPLQGLIHVHHLAALFDLDELPNTCDAYRTHVGTETTGPTGSTTGAKS